MSDEAKAVCDAVVLRARERTEHLRQLTAKVDPACLREGPPDFIRRDHANYLLARRAVVFGSASLSVFDADFAAPMAALDVAFSRPLWCGGGCSPIRRSPRRTLTLPERGTSSIQDHDTYDVLVVIAGGLAIALMDAVAIYEAWVCDRSIPEAPELLKA